MRSALEEDEFYVQAKSIFDPEARKLLEHSLAVGLFGISRNRPSLLLSSDNQALSMLVTSSWAVLHTFKERDTDVGGPTIKPL